MLELRILGVLLLLAIGPTDGGATRGAEVASPPGSSEVLLFDFEDEAGARDWSPVKLPDLKDDQPAPQIEIVAEKATSGKRCLKLTFDGGVWPAVSTARLPVGGTWNEYRTLRADITVDRPCVVGFRVCQEKSADDALDNDRSRWNKTMILQEGRNEVVVLIHDRGNAVHDRWGAVTTFIVDAFQPAKGQVVYLDHVRLGRDMPKVKFSSVSHLWSPYSLGGYSSVLAREYEKTGELARFAVLGTDWTVSDPMALSEKLKSAWTRRKPQAVDEVEADFALVYQQLKKEHPRAVMAVFRDGQKGYDPANPERVYAGWRDTHISSHGPDGPNDWRQRSHGSLPRLEAFMRHRSALMSVDLQSIPVGAKILAGRLVIARAMDRDSKRPEKPNMWVVEPCRRAWDEQAANCYYYAPEKLWAAHNGCSYGDDGDFCPVYVAHGPGGAGEASVWDFLDAVKFWTCGRHENHGFMLHGDSHDHMQIHSRESQELKKRPAVLVIYEAKASGHE